MYDGLIRLEIDHQHALLLFQLPVQTDLMIRRIQYAEFALKSLMAVAEADQLHKTLHHFCPTAARYHPLCNSDD